MSTMQYRLLWRGKMLENSQELYGIAIIAHLDLKPNSNFNSNSNEHLFGPFAAGASTDICLGLEMHRHADLCIKEKLNLVLPVTESESEQPVEREEEERGKACFVRVPVKVHAYVDERCRETVSWFEWLLQEGRGIKFSLGAKGEDLVLFSAIPSQVEDRETSIGGSKELDFLVGMPVLKPTRTRPRPDDPLPRENLFLSRHKFKLEGSKDESRLFKGRELDKKPSSKAILEELHPRPRLERSVSTPDIYDFPKRKPNNLSRSKSILGPDIQNASRTRTRKTLMNTQASTMNAESRASLIKREGSVSLGAVGREFRRTSSTVSFRSLHLERTRSVSVIPGEDPTGFRATNKQVVKKQIIAKLESRGITKPEKPPNTHTNATGSGSGNGGEEDVFNDLYSLLYRGVLFVFRDRIGKEMLDTGQIESTMEDQLALYLPSLDVEINTETEVSVEESVMDYIEEV